MVPNGWTHENFQTLKISTVDGDRGKNYPQKTDYHSEGYSLFLGADNVADGKLNLDKCIFLTKEKHESMGKGIAREDDILLVMRGNGTGRSCIYRGEIKSFQARINSGLVIIRHNKEYTNIEFLHQLFQSPLIKKQFEGYMFGSAQPQLTIQLLKSLRLCIPKLEEQEKIAQVLSTWDQAISTTEKILENSQQQKKALMQQLLTGKKRLLDERGNLFQSKFIRSALKELFSINKGQQLNRDTLLSQGNYAVINGGVEPSGYTDVYNVESNTITISEGGNSCGYVGFQEFPFWCGGHCYALSNYRLNIGFTYQLLKFNERQIMRLRVGSGLPNIQKKDLECLMVSYPDCEFEQAKIAKVLSLADQEIDTLQKKLDCLKQEKKALMQQLLTGKKRIKVAV